MSIKARLKKSDKNHYRLLRYAYNILKNINMPLPKTGCVIAWKIVNIIKKLYYWSYSIIWVTTLYRGFCVRVGKNFKAGTYVPYVEGLGNVYVGDDVRFYGKQDYIFGGIRDDVPEIHIGDGTVIGHNITFDIAGILTIGQKCLISRNVTFQDSRGHSINANERIEKRPAKEKDVYGIIVGNNVWIGTGSYIMPGVQIGNNCVIAAQTIVRGNIPDNSLVYSMHSKAIKIREISNIF